MSLPAGELAEVAILAEAERMVGFVRVFAVGSQLGPPVAVIARLAEALGVKRLVSVWACKHFLKFSPLPLSHRLRRDHFDRLHVVILVIFVLVVQLFILLWWVSGWMYIRGLVGHLLAHESAKNLALVGDAL